MKHRPPVKKTYVGSACGMPLGYLGFQAIKVYNGIYIYIHTWSLHYHSFLGSFAKDLFLLGAVGYFFGRFMKIPTVCLPNMCGLYILSVASLITKLNHVNVLCFSCLMLDQAPLSFQAQAHD